MENQSKQNLTSLPKESQKLALSESKESRDKLDEILGACLALQKLYGRDVANAGTIIDLFQRMMGKYPADKVINAFEVWMERSQEFPTPADIVSLVKRNGKPPLRESDIIAIRKKDGADRMPDEWAMLREWDAQAQDGWADDVDPQKQDALLQENIRLRQKIEMLEQRETQRGETARKPFAPQTQLSQAEKIKITVMHMRASGAPESDIEEFCQSQGVSVEDAAA